MAVDTAMEKGAFTFIWKIENFSHCLQEVEGFQSPNFTVDPLNKSRWFITFHPKNSDKCAEDFLNYYLYCIDWRTSDFAVDYQLSLVSADGSILRQRKALGATFNSNKLQCWEPNIFRLKDICETKSSFYLLEDTLTVFCRLWKTNGDIGEHIQCLARSRLGVKRMSKIWNIPNYSRIMVRDESSPTVSLAGMDHTEMVLKVLFKRVEADIFLSIQINREKCPSKLLLSWTISLLNRNKIPVTKMQDKRMCLPNQELSWTSSDFITRTELMESDDLLPQDVLTLKFEFTFSFGVQYENIECIHYGPPTSLSEDSIETWWNTTELSPDRPVIESYLKSDLQSLYKDHTVSDFELRSEGVSFPVHKAILCARSPVFKAMFTSDMQEGSTNFLNVPDVDAKTLTRMLLYFYTDTIKESGFEDKLYYASDKYQILSLKQKCSSIMKSNLTVTDVSMVLSLADRHHDDELTSAIHEFILSKDEKVMRSTEWEEFVESNSFLAAKAMLEVYKMKLQIKSYN